MKFRVKVFILGLIKEYIMVLGLKIKWREEDKFLGRMVKVTMDTIKMIHNMALAFLFGRMDDNLLAHGIMANKTDMLFIIAKENKKLENGKMV